MMEITWRAVTAAISPKKLRVRHKETLSPYSVLIRSCMMTVGEHEIREEESSNVFSLTLTSPNYKNSPASYDTETY